MVLSKFYRNIAPCKVIALNLLYFIYGIGSLLLFLITLSKVIALPTIPIAKNLPLLFTNTFKSVKNDNYCCHNSWKNNNYMEINTEKKQLTNLQNQLKN